MTKLTEVSKAATLSLGTDLVSLKIQKAPLYTCSHAFHGKPIQLTHLSFQSTLCPKYASNPNSYNVRHIQYVRESFLEIYCLTLKQEKGKKREKFTTTFNSYCSLCVLLV